MSWFDNLRKKKPETVAAPVAVSPPPQKQTAPKMFKVWDKYGRMMEISSEDWRTRVLPGSFKDQWNKPDELYDTILSALHDGFIHDCLEPSRHLCTIDTKPPRGSVTLGVVLLQLSRVTEAEKVLVDAIRRYGEETYLLSNLAKVYSAQGKTDLVEGTLWHALEVDPNQENGLLWWAVLNREKSGQQGYEEALRKAANVTGSWRAQLWLARLALERKDVPSALKFYRHVIEVCSPMPPDALMQMSGDLGKNGCLREIVELCAPVFDPKQHGLKAGNNLLKVYVDLKDGPAARRILEQLYAAQRPDWKENLLFWEGEIDKLDKGYGPVPESQKLQVSMVTLEEPIWARSKSPFAELLPLKLADALKVGFICGSAENPPSPHGSQMIHQPTNAIGRFSRSLPMFLSEQAFLQTSARTILYVPWLRSGGFVLAGGPWTIDHLEADNPKPDYVIFLHLIAKQEPWRARLQLVRIIDQKILAEWGSDVVPNKSTEAVQAIVAQMFFVLKSQADIATIQCDKTLLPPEGELLPGYMDGLEQSLAVSCASLAPDTKPFLFAERDIIDHLLDMSIRLPSSVPMRSLLLSTVEREARARPDVAKEYKARLDEIMREFPLAPAAQTLAQAMMARIFTKN